MTTEEAMQKLGCETQAELARKLNTSRQAITNWNGTVPPVREHHINLLARAVSKAK